MNQLVPYLTTREIALILGFSGTQKGMSEYQVDFFRNYFKIMQIIYDDALELDHGDCIGADAQMHALGRENNLWIAGHPPINNSKRAFCKTDISFPAKPYLDRNKNIVDRSHKMLFAPEGPEKLRSGTWSTVRYARKQEKSYILVYPSGDSEVYPA